MAMVSSVPPPMVLSTSPAPQPLQPQQVTASSWHAAPQAYVTASSQQQQQQQPLPPPQQIQQPAPAGVSAASSSVDTSHSHHKRSADGSMQGAPGPPLKQIKQEPSMGPPPGPAASPMPAVPGLITADAAQTPMPQQYLLPGQTSSTPSPGPFDLARLLAAQGGVPASSGTNNSMASMITALAAQQPTAGAGSSGSSGMSSTLTALLQSGGTEALHHLLTLGMGTLMAAAAHRQQQQQLQPPQQLPAAAAAPTSILPQHLQQQMAAAGFSVPGLPGISGTPAPLLQPMRSIEAALHTPVGSMSDLASLLTGAGPHDASGLTAAGSLPVHMAAADASAGMLPWASQMMGQPWVTAGPQHHLHQQLGSLAPGCSMMPVAGHQQPFPGHTAMLPPQATQQQMQQQHGINPFRQAQLQHAQVSPQQQLQQQHSVSNHSHSFLDSPMDPALEHHDVPNMRQLLGSDPFLQRMLHPMGNDSSPMLHLLDDPDLAAVMHLGSSSLPCSRRASEAGQTASAGHRRGVSLAGAPPAAAAAAAGGATGQSFTLSLSSLAESSPRADASGGESALARSAAQGGQSGSLVAPPGKQEFSGAASVTHDGAGSALAASTAAAGSSVARHGTDVQH
eukprot:CAMPEP_0202896472 /NCGR_PEP_ID=MMETSP1392-20130828/5470_1 /ASSEMBLY_ACC=CAM_ASM_000868 /TAXON_ID=225041 /ORGANISM="Chlamydomonas chlamydogama, Strain SAG 11-48b" /LENGTH=620 /DNA_ID=CAMNT_0049581843 /DNA_START=19 /DNA_END=1881 /DNA_ORIENTATION=+